MTFRPLVVQSLVRRNVTTPDFVQNLLDTTLAGKDNIPTGRASASVSALPNPVILPFKTNINLGHTQSTSLGLQNPNIQAVDMSNPVRSTVRRQDFQNPAETQLIGKDQFFGAAGQAPNYDWPNPVRAKVRNEFGFIDTFKLTLATIPSPPFAQLDWPNPILRKWNLQDFQNPSEIQLFGQDQIYGGAGQVPVYDWTNPVRTKVRNEFGFTNAFDLNLSIPFAQLDWPNPVLRKWNLQDFQNPSETQLIGQDQFFNSAGQVPVYDWTNPVRVKVSNEYGFIDTFKLTLSVTPPPPFAQLDWPNPVRAKVSNEFGFVYSFLSNYPQPPKTYARPPVFQRIARQPADYYTAINSQISQHNSQIMFPANVGTTGVVATAFAGTVPFVAPISQTDWPNPVLRKRTEFGHIDFMVLNSQDTFYGTFGQVPVYDWPNPVRAKVRNEFGYIDFMVLNSQDIVHDAPGEVAVYDWPNPVRAKVRNEFGFIAPSKPFIISGTNVIITGVVSSASAGNVLLGTLANITGVVGTATAGTLSTTITSNISITGVVGTATVGTAIPNPDAIVSGVAGTAIVGTIIPQVGAVISGAAGTAIAGSIVLSGAPTASGVAGTAIAGNLTPSVAVTALGVVGTTSAGTVTPSVAVTALGVVGTTSAGTVTPSVAPSITGVVGTTSAGTITPAVAKTLTGVAASAAAGTISFSGAINVGITGVVGTTSAGTLTTTASASILITGVVGTTSAGNATISTTASPSLTGAIATASAGNALPQDRIDGIGVVGTTSAGTVTPRISGVPSGVVANATAGVVASLIQNAIQGAQITASAGTVSDIIQFALLGAQARAFAGNASGTVSPTADILGAMATTQIGNISVFTQDQSNVAAVLGAMATAYAGFVTTKSVSHHIKKIITQTTVSRIHVDMT